jgi:hypothetical protein
MRVTRILGLGSICFSAGIAVWACGDDEATGPAVIPDGGISNPESGSAGDTGTGGDTGLPPFDAGTDAALWCGHIDGGSQSRCATYQWDDFAPTDAGFDADLGASNCKACPGRVLTCADLVRRIDGGGTQVLSPRYDHYQTKTLSVDVTPHAGEIVGGAVTVTHTQCYGSPQFDASVVTVQAQVRGNTIEAPLANNLGDAGTYDGPCGEITYQLVDSCCTPSTVKFETFFDPENGLFKTSCPDGG